MDFGDILEQWEAGRSRVSGNGKPFASGGEWERILRVKEGGGTEDPALRRAGLRALAPEARIDLHGMDREEARTALDRFFADASRRRLRKVLIIHGKGNHSGSEPVLPGFVRGYLAQCPHAGETGKADRAFGGSGATWVILKK